MAGVAYFNSLIGCHKCTTIGAYNNDSRTVVFEKTQCSLRTDEEFRQRKYGLYHKYDSPLEALPIDMVNQFIVGDSLHLLLRLF